MEGTDSGGGRGLYAGEVRVTGAASASLFLRFRKRGPIARLNQATADLNVFADRMATENRRMLDAMIEDENRPRNWKLVVIGTDGARHSIPLKCSLKQVRKIKIAIHDADGDALAVES